jgi:hypothetical protein
MIFTGYNLLFFSVTTFTAAHFNILAMILKDSTKIILLSGSTQAKRNSISATENLLKDRTHEWQTRKDCSKHHREVEVSEGLHTSEELQLRTNVKEDETGNIQQRYDPADYLIQCIKYHQALLE